MNKYNIVWKPLKGSQQLAVSCPCNHILYEGTRGPGKGLPLSEPVLTPLGFIPISRIKLGDKIVCPDGSNSKVIGVFPQGKRRIFNIRFDDGSKINTDDVHIHDVYIGNDKKHNLVTTKELIELFENDTKIYFKIPKRIYYFNKRTNDNAYGTGYVYYSGVKTANIQREILCNWENRIEIVQGIFDVKGRMESDDLYCIPINSNINITHVLFLLRSVACKAWVSKNLIYFKTGNKFSPSKYITVTHKDEVDLYKRVTSINFKEYNQSVCIKIKNPTGLFITRDYTITHNTDAQLMFFRKYVGLGYGEFMRGVIFDRKYKNLDDLISKSKRWFRQFGDGAKFISSTSHLKWVWPTGEELWFRVMNCEQDYWNYHGHEFPIIGWNELTKYPDSELYDMAMSLNRSSFVPENYPIKKNGKNLYLPEIPQVVFSTTNPYGVGHNWVKQRFIDVAPPGKIVTVERKVFNPRTQQKELVRKTQVRIFGSYKENIYLSPEYVLELESIKDENKRKAWLQGNWDITAGGMFDDVWSSTHNIVEPFNIPLSWRIIRTFDWGSSAPFSVGWWAVSDGSDVVLNNGVVVSTIRGDLFRISEWYGWNGTPNKGLRMLARDIAKGIIEREIKMGLYGRVNPGPADSSIYDNVNGVCIASDMENNVIINNAQYPGAKFIRADKSPGTRKAGWELIRNAIFNAQPDENSQREFPGLFVFNTCKDGFIRTVPTIPRDTKDPDDVDTDAEDHVCDETRYTVLQYRDNFKSGSVIGNY